MATFRDIEEEKVVWFLGRTGVEYGFFFFWGLLLGKVLEYVREIFFCFQGKKVNYFSLF